jgi:excisionase family DNA binding protein
MTDRTSSVPRLALTVAEAAASLGVSDDFFREHVAPELRLVRAGRKRLVGVRELEKWIDRSASRVFEEAS